MSECHRTKSLLKGIMIVFKTKGPQIRCIPHGSFGLSQCKSSSKKNMLVDKISRINFKIEGPQKIKAAAALNAIYKANQSNNCPFKLEVVLQFLTC